MGRCKSMQVVSSLKSFMRNVPHLPRSSIFCFLMLSILRGHLQGWTSANDCLIGKLLFNCSVMSDSLWPHGLQHARLPCPSGSPGTCSNSCPLSWHCHSTFSSSVSPFSSCPQSSPASGSFPISWLFPLSGQSIGASASVYSELPQNSPLDSFNMMAWWLQHYLCERQHFFFFHWQQLPSEV